MELINVIIPYNNQFSYSFYIFLSLLFKVNSYIFNNS